MLSLKKTGTLLSLGLLILGLGTGCSEWRSNKTVGENIDDTATCVEIKSRLAAEKDISAKNIHLSCYKGTVQMSGFVKSQDNLQKALRITRSVKGVKKVINDLKVTP